MSNYYFALTDHDGTFVGDFPEEFSELGAAVKYGKRILDEMSFDVPPTSQPS